MAGSIATLPDDESRYFGTQDRGRITELLDAFCRSELGTGLDSELFHETSVNSVHGVRLRDGRRVVIKVSAGGADPEHFDAVQRIQRRIQQAGFPCPQPLVGPTSLGPGIAIAEEFLDIGLPPDVGDLAACSAIAGGLARLIDLCRSIDGPTRLGLGPLARLPADHLYWPSRTARIDLAGTANAAGWIDAIASQAREILRRTGGGAVVGHCDWRADHLRFEFGDLCAVYDWDSLVLMREAEFVASAAYAHLIDRRALDPFGLPSMEDCERFVADYEHHRDRPFIDSERATIDAVLAFALAYDTRVHLANVMTAFGTRPAEPPPKNFHELGRGAVLSTWGPKLLERATRFSARA